MDYIAIFMRAPDRVGTQLKLLSISEEIDYRNNNFYIFLINQDLNDYIQSRWLENEIFFDLEKLKTTMADLDANNEDFLNSESYDGMLDTTQQTVEMIKSHLIEIPREVA